MNPRANPKVLTEPSEINKLADTLRAEAAQGRPWFAVDTEFIRETTFFPKIALIQIGTETESWLVDPVALSKEQLKPLLDLLTDPKFLKVFHAAQADQECFYTTYGVTATPCFDTAAGAALCGMGESVGLAKLIKELFAETLPKGHARTDWLARPIPEQLMRYAHQDVHFLLPAMKILFERLEKAGRKEWAMELSAKYSDGKLYEPNPHGIAMRLSRSGKLDRRGVATLRELVAWRETRVRELDVPRKRVAEDDILVDLAMVRPKDMAHLSTFRGLNKGELRSSGEAILAAVKRAAMLPESELPVIQRAEVADGRETRAIELIQCYMKIISEDLQIAPRLLVTGDDLLPILRRRFGSAQELVDAGVLSAGAARLIGAELFEMLNGRRGLSLRNGQVAVTKL